MNEQLFHRIVEYFNRHAGPRYTLHFVYKALPLQMFISYPLLLIYAFFYMPDALLDLIFVPFGVFVGVTLIRIMVNETRPYEKYQKPSVFFKDTSGKSFPSRHTASAFIIALAFLYVSTPAGIVALCVAVLILLSRIFSGAHYIRDVVGGMLISLIAGIVFFFLI